jgi:hypothetical protein
MHQAPPVRTALAGVLLAVVMAGTAVACGTTPGTGGNTPVTPGTVAPRAPTTQSTAPAALPTDLAGENGQVAYEELKKAGFSDPVFHSDTGKAVILYSDWTVVSAHLEHGTAVVEVKK